MINHYLDKVLPFLQTIPQERRDKFYAYFGKAPMWVLNSFQIDVIPHGTTFIRAGTPVDTIYFIGYGVIKGTDYRILGVSFDFMIFTDVYAYGGMEVIMDFATYQASLKTVTDCIAVKIPRDIYREWIKSDLSALAYEAKLMGQYLLEQARNNRVFLLLQGTDRLIMLLTILYEQEKQTKRFVIDNDRQKLADYTGLSVKTITRVVQSLEKEGLLTKNRLQIEIDHSQYERMKKKLAEILSSDE